MSHAENIVAYLAGEITLRKACKNPPNRNGFCSLSDFIHHYAIDWNPAKVKACPKDLPKQCFRNAALLALSDKKLTYVEGYAAAIIPVMHAWCVTPDRKILEPTWREIGLEYFGIPFRKDYLRSRLKKYGSYGLIDQWEFDHPIINEPPELWLNPIFGL